MLCCVQEGGVYRGGGGADTHRLATHSNQASPTAGGPRQSLTSEIRLTPLPQEELGITGWHRWGCQNDVCVSCCGMLPTRRFAHMTGCPSHLNKLGCVWCCCAVDCTAPVCRFDGSFPAYERLLLLRELLFVADVLLTVPQPSAGLRSLLLLMSGCSGRQLVQLNQPNATHLLKLPLVLLLL